MRTITCSFSSERRCQRTMAFCLVHWEDDSFRSSSSGTDLCLVCRKRLHRATNVLCFFWWQRVPDSPTLLLRWIKGLSDTFRVVFQENVPTDSWKKLLWWRSCLFLSSMEKRGEFIIQLSCPHQPRELPLWRRVFLSTQSSDRLRQDTHTHTHTHAGRPWQLLDIHSLLHADECCFVFLFTLRLAWHWPQSSENTAHLFLNNQCCFIQRHS